MEAALRSAYEPLDSLGLKPRCSFDPVNEAVWIMVLAAKDKGKANQVRCDESRGLRCTKRTESRHNRHTCLNAPLLRCGKAARSDQVCNTP